MNTKLYSIIFLMKIPLCLPKFLLNKSHFSINSYFLKSLFYSLFNYLISKKLIVTFLFIILFQDNSELICNIQTTQIAI